MKNKDIIQLLVNGSVNKAFAALIELVINQKEYNDLLNDVITGHSSFNTINNEYLKGVIDIHQFSQFNNKAITLILSVLQEIDKIPIVNNTAVSDKKNINFFAQSVTLNYEVQENIKPSEERTIFVFGKVAVGKTTLIQSLGNFLANSNEYEIAFTSNNSKEIIYWNEAINIIKNIVPDDITTFPSRTQTGTISKLSIAIRNKNIKPRLLSFVEASGEDLTKIVDKERNNPNLFQKEIEQSSHFLFIASADDINDDLLFYQFFQYLSERKTSYKAGIIISKWDLLYNPRTNLSSFIFDKMPMTSKNLLTSTNIIDNKVFNFSILNSIEKQDFSSENNIINWINH